MLDPFVGYRTTFLEVSRREYFTKIQITYQVPLKICLKKKLFSQQKDWLLHKCVTAYNKCYTSLDFHGKKACNGVSQRNGATAQRFYTVKRVQQENFATHSRIRLRMEFGRE
jgi:hypothetical protein